MPAGKTSFPRARGDVPRRPGGRPLQHRFSPRTRGCSDSLQTAVTQPLVFPAHAGMFRAGGHRAVSSRSFPRARGDVPHREFYSKKHIMFSPRTRGCSEAASELGIARSVFPAHAGMFLEQELFDGKISGFPRARGDVPRYYSVDVVYKSFSPRTRGCSERKQKKSSPAEFSPRTRGCSRCGWK